MFYLGFWSCIVQIISVCRHRIFRWHHLLALCFAQQCSYPSVASISLSRHNSVLFLLWIGIWVLLLDRFDRSMQLPELVKTLHFRRLQRTAHVIQRVLVQAKLIRQASVVYRFRVQYGLVRSLQRLVRYGVYSIGCRLCVIWSVTAKPLYLLQLLFGAIHLKFLTNLIKISQFDEVCAVCIHMGKVPVDILPFISKLGLKRLSQLFGHSCW